MEFQITDDRAHKILIVDDDTISLHLLGNILGNKYKLAIAKNGRSAINLAKEIKPDLILLDIMMPGIDGFKVCENLKDNPETEQIPIIFITAKNDINSIVKGFELGASDYITKPFNSQELMARVNTHLQLKIKTDKLRLIKSILESKVESYKESFNHLLRAVNGQGSKKDD